MSDSEASADIPEATPGAVGDMVDAHDSILGIVTAGPLSTPLAPIVVSEPTVEQVTAALDAVEPTKVEHNYDLEKLLRRKIKASAHHAFFVVDLGILREQVNRWRELLPRVEMFYAIKCNPNPVMLKELAAMGIGFDCASQAEIRTVLRLGVSPDRIIFANPCKMPSHIAYSRTEKVKMMTFDNIDELIKTKHKFAKARLVLRIATDDSSATSHLSLKFGAKEPQWAALLEKAKALGLNVVGVSFHVGSGCRDPKAYDSALRAARRVFDAGIALGFTMELLDIGGGFPGLDTEPGASFADMATVINPLLTELFPPSVRVIAEPGRYVATRTHTLAVNIYARRITPEQHVLYVDDGVYGSLSNIVWDHQEPTPIPLAKGVDKRPRYPTTIFGPTCDSIDCICREKMLPEMNIDEWFYFTNMGAYTAASACHFNGFLTSKFFYIDSKKKQHKNKRTAAATGRVSPAKAART